MEVLNAVYEPAFMGFSHGFRPGRNPHQALAYGIRCRPVNWILDADIASFFDTVDHDWLLRFVEHRIADRRLHRLIKLWLEAGVLEAGRIIASEEGTLAGRGHLAGAGQPLPALCVRPLGAPLAAPAGPRRSHPGAS